MTATCPLQTSSSACVRSQTVSSDYKINVPISWNSSWMSTSSCLRQSISRLWTRACAITQCCTSLPKSQESLKPRRDARFFSVLRCTGPQKSRWSRSQKPWRSSARSMKVSILFVSSRFSPNNRIMRTKKRQRRQISFKKLDTTKKGSQAIPKDLQPWRNLSCTLAAILLV